mgnify:CR=1 FL=1
MADAWAQPFLTALRATGVVSVAARRIGISPTTVYARRKSDADLDQAIEEALEEATDVMEAEMVRRAVEGVEEPVVYQGSLATVIDPETGVSRPLTVNKRSDTLLMFALKGRRKVYATERTELSGRDGEPLGSLSETERAARVEALLAIAAKRKAAAEDDLL